MSILEEEMGVLACCRTSKRTYVFFVASAFFLDNILLTAIVPIMPDFLYSLKYASDSLQLENAPFDDTNGTTSSINATNTSTSLVQSHSWNVSTETALQKRHTNLIQETYDLGILYASKPFIHLITIPLVGMLMGKFNSDVLLLWGFIVTFFSTIFFAFGESYLILFIARSIQGFGSAFITLAGINIIAELYQNNHDRGNALAFTLTGTALGGLLGPTYGGVLYDFVGKSEPFLIIATLCLAAICFQLCLRRPSIRKQKMELQPVLAVISDPYILISCGAITVANFGISFLEPSLPVWMIDTMNARQWQQGAVFLPESICYLLSTNYVAQWGTRFGRWRVSMIGFIILGMAFILLPLVRSFVQTIIPTMIMGFSIGLVDGSMVPELGNLADMRHAAYYGAVYALEEIAVCSGNMLAPIFSGVFINSFGFEITSLGIGMLCFLFSPFLHFLKNPPSLEEEKLLFVL